MYKTLQFTPIEKSPRIQKLVDGVFAKKPCIEAERAILVTEAYRDNAKLPTELRRAKALEHILKYMPIVIRDHELIVGNTTKQAHAASLFPEFSLSWVVDEFDTLADRNGDPFDISEEVKDQIREILPYWEGRSVSELGLYYMAPETRQAFDMGVFDVGSYTFMGVGMVSADYEGVIKDGLHSVMERTREELSHCDMADPKMVKKRCFLKAVLISCQSVIDFANRFADLAEKQAQSAENGRKEELLKIAEICRRVPEYPARDFYEAIQSLWFIQIVIQIESNGHSISPLRFDQYMYPYYRQDLDSGKLTRESAQELIDCLWVKFNEVNKLRDKNGAKAFGGYPMFQNICVGGQDKHGRDATNELSFACIEATEHLMLPAPSLAVRVWSGTPDELMMKAAECTRLGFGMPAFYNDEVIIPGLLNRGMSIDDARDYGIMGCVEPSKAGKTNGWHGAAFFNMVKPLLYAMNDGKDGEVQIGPHTGKLEDFKSFDEFYRAYEIQMNYFIRLLANAENSADAAHAERGQLPFLSSIMDDCISRGMDISEGGAIYNFTGPQGVGVANVADSLQVIKSLVFDRHEYTLAQIKAAMDDNFGESSREILEAIERVPKYGNDILEVDELAKKVSALYCDEVEKYHNFRGGIFEPGLYPVSANVPMGEITGASPDGRRAGTALAEGISPAAGRDTNGPTAVVNSCSVIDQEKASNGTLLNQKFHPSVLKGRSGLEKLNALIRGYFEEKGMHIQFNVISRETLVEAQKHPENYQNLVVRVAGYSAHFVSLDKGIQDDIINRTEQVM